MTAELDDAGLKRGPRPSRGRPEDERDRPAVERIGAEGSRLEDRCALQDVLKLVCGQLFTGQKMAGQVAQCTLRPAAADPRTAVDRWTREYARVQRTSWDTGARMISSDNV